MRPRNRLLIRQGTKYGKLTVIKDGVNLRLPCGQVNRTMTCRCECGTVKNVRLAYLVRGKTKSCGCSVGLDGRHGHVGTRIYKIWLGMRNRCKEAHVDRRLYFDRGIKVCDDWQNSFLRFMEWAMSNGYNDDLTIDRIDGNLNYCPENCRFVEPVINCNNRENTVMVKYKGNNMSLRLLLLKKGKREHFSAIQARIKRGWDVDIAVDTPIRKGNYYRKNKPKKLKVYPSKSSLNEILSSTN